METNIDCTCRYKKRIDELFEILVNNMTLQVPFNILDTISDLCFDLSGAFVSILYFTKRIVFSNH